MQQIRELSKKDFPKRLLEIPDQPKKLFIRGELPPEEYKWLCVVGSRKYSNYGKEACEKLIAGLRGYPVIIVSGLALGMDSIAHRAALAAGLKTVAVPGSGIDDSVLYPSSNRELAKKILENGGCVLSEFEPDFRATTWSFPQRNRIMAGLSDAVFVIEAEIKSGTLITSRLATDYNRDVFTVPGSIFSKTSEGPHMLIGLGATAITSSEDIVKALGLELKTNDHKLTTSDYADCSEKERKVLEFLKEPNSRDEVTRALSLSASEANTLLGILEIKGLIKESMGELHLI
jgi:DNA processing protein